MLLIVTSIIFSFIFNFHFLILQILCHKIIVNTLAAADYNDSGIGIVRVTYIVEREWFHCKRIVLII
jgi:hypothetical protein